MPTAPCSFSPHPPLLSKFPDRGWEGLHYVGWYKYFQRGFLTNDGRFVAGDTGQYNGGGYSSGHNRANNSDPGAPRRAGLLPARRLLTWRLVLTWRSVLPAGCARGNLMLRFYLAHVRDIIHCWHRDYGCRPIRPQPSLRGVGSLNDAKCASFHHRVSCQFPVLTEGSHR
jgi:hypothetical protein